VSLTLVGAALLAAAYFGTEIYNYYIPNIAGRHDFSLGLAAVSVVGGIAALLSPCAFGMLPSYFAFFLSAHEPPRGPSLARTVGASLRYGVATAAGITLAGAILALLIGAIGEAFAPDLRVVTSDPNHVTRAIRLVAGVLLVSLGVAHICGVGLPWSAAAAADRLRTRTDRPMLWFFAYGLLYILVALPCTANLMAAPVLYGLSTGGTELAAAAAGLFLATMAVMSMVVALLVGLSKDAVLHQFQVSARHIQTVAALFFVAVGLALIYLNLDLDLFRRTFFDFPIEE
jgi:cytochrome c biogenesis protein CcdA